MKKIFILLSILFVLYADKPSLQKPKIYQGDENITGWFMSEKLDGIRGYWDGKRLKSKNGYTIHVPEWFIKDFPPFKLDGELWTKRADFENIQSIVLDDKPSSKWNEITYNIFEVPFSEGNFSQRLNYVKLWIKENNIKHIKVIPQIRCKNKKHLISYLNKIEKLRGEGIILKNPNLSYFTGRSSQILKVKSFNDMEGEVIAINKGKGKFKNIMGSLSIKLKNGVVFKLGGGFSIKERGNPPKINSIVTFKYYGFTKNLKPKYASFMRVRKEK
jgi:DNA ligase-1